MGLAQTKSGIVVPEAVLDELQKATQITQQRTEGFDLDGRRRVVLTRDETKILDRVIRLMAPFGIGMVYCCTPNPDSDYRTVAAPCPNGCVINDASGALVERDTDCTLEHTGQMVTLLKPDVFKKCGGVIVPEGRDTANPGYGCACTRIHIQQVHGPARRIR